MLEHVSENGLHGVLVRILDFQKLYNSTYQQALALEVTRIICRSCTETIIRSNFLDYTITLSLHQRGNERTASIFIISRTV